jgi:phage gpG-like protein
MLTIEVNDRLVLDALQDLMHRVQDTRPVMAGIGQEMVSRVSARFETQADPLGQAWAPWQPATRKSYPANGNGRILDHTGTMLDGLSFQVNKERLAIGFDVP